MQAQEINKSEVKKKKVPKGTSSYQAAWIVESDHEDDEDEEGEGEENEDAMVWFPPSQLQFISC